MCRTPFVQGGRLVVLRQSKHSGAHCMINRGRPPSELTGRCYVREQLQQVTHDTYNASMMACIRSHSEDDATDDTILDISILVVPKGSCAISEAIPYRS